MMAVTDAVAALMEACRLAPSTPVTAPTGIDVTDHRGKLVAALNARCSRCDDTGYLTEEDERGHWWSKRCPTCADLRRRADTFTHAELPGGPFAKARLSTTDWSVPALAAHRVQLEAWVKAWSEGGEAPSSLGLAGPNQRGKTHVLVAIGRHLALSGVNVRFVRMPRLLELPRLEAFALRAQLRSPDVDLLILDEVGGGDAGYDWITTAYEELLGLRLESGGCCLISTNYNPEGEPGDPMALVDCVGERVMGRLDRYADFITVEGEPFRRTRRTA